MKNANKRVRNMCLYSAFVEAISIDQSSHVASAKNSKNIHIKRLAPRVELRVTDILAKSGHDMMCNIRFEIDDSPFAHVPGERINQAVPSPKK